MSFSSEVKKELCTRMGGGRHCEIAELLGIINTCGVIFSNELVIFIKIQTENAIVAKKFFTLVKNNFNITSNVTVSKIGKKNRTYSVLINDYNCCRKILSAVGILKNVNGEIVVKKGINPLIVKSVCCKRSYIRGVFIAGGSLNAPEKTYHLEFVNSSFELSESLKNLINFFKLNSKIIERKGHFVVYLKEGENIVDLLNIMEAHICVLGFHNVQILKDMRNNVNRLVNCETANIRKTVDASVKQIDDIKFIESVKGLGYLDKQLQQVARLRIENPEATLQELGELLCPPVGKSGTNHRLRKISQIAYNLRIKRKED